MDVPDRAEVIPEPTSIARCRELLGDEADALNDDEVRDVARHAEAIAAALLAEPAAVLAIDRRLVPDRPVGAAAEDIAQPRLYKSWRLRPDQIDNLYNEVLLLDQKLP